MTTLLGGSGRILENDFVFEVSLLCPFLQCVKYACLSMFAFLGIQTRISVVPVPLALLVNLNASIVDVVCLRIVRRDAEIGGGDVAALHRWVGNSTRVLHDLALVVHDHPQVVLHASHFLVDGVWLFLDAACLLHQRALHGVHLLAGPYQVFLDLLDLVLHYAVGLVMFSHFLFLLLI